MLPDIDECTVGSDNCLDTSSQGECINVPGSFSCQCVAGYGGDGVSSCTGKNVGEGINVFISRYLRLYGTVCGNM